MTCDILYQAEITHKLEKCHMSRPDPIILREENRNVICNTENCLYGKN